MFTPFINCNFCLTSDGGKGVSVVYVQGYGFHLSADCTFPERYIGIKKELYAYLQDIICLNSMGIFQNFRLRFLLGCAHGIPKLQIVIVFLSLSLSYNK